MAEKDKYIIQVQGKLIEVTPDVYYAYFHMERQERGQEEKKQRNNVMSYDALDTTGTVGAETFPDLIAPSMEDVTLTNEINARLHHAIEALPKAERELIQAIYFDGLTTREYAKLSGLSQTGVSYRLRKILSKLKSFMNFMGSF